MPNKRKVQDYYNGTAASYHEQYQRDFLYDTSRDYPANYFRMQMMLNSFVRNDVKRVVEIGVGEGTPLSTLSKAGIDAWGFDISEGMVAKSKETMKQNGLNPEQISWGDIQAPSTYMHLLQGGRFDAAMAMGVMPHVENDTFVLNNISTLVKKNGKVFIEFRNKLFSLFTFNRYTLEFILDDLLSGVDAKLLDLVRKDLESKLRMDLPPKREHCNGGSSPGYDAILSKFHNPFEVMKTFSHCNYTDMKLLWYHYHPAMPSLQHTNEDIFRREAIKLEHDPSDWRGLFLCSAFVVEATNGDNNEK